MTDRNAELDAWAQVGIDAGWAVRSGHYAYDGQTWVPTLVLQTTAVIALHGAAVGVVQGDPPGSSR